MLSPEAYDDYCDRLELARMHRRDTSAEVWPTADDAGTGVLPIEIGPGRGDLDLSSSNWPTFPTSLALIGHRRVVSFSRLFQEQPWIAACVMWLLTRAMRVPLHAYKGDPSGEPGSAKRLMAGEHPLADALERPWAGAATIDLQMAMLGPVFVHGNSVIEVDDSGRTGQPLAFRPNDWRYCRPVMPWRGEIDGWHFDIDIPSRMRSLGVLNVLHTRYWSPVGPIGVSPLQQLGITIQIEDAAQRYQRAVFAHGARPPSAITADKEFLGIEGKERRAIMRQLRRDVMEIYSGPENAGRPALLPPGLDWKAIGHSSVEVELINQRRITREECCAVYLIPLLALLALDTKGTAANVQIQRDMTYTECLGPPLVLAESAFNAQIVRDLMQWDDVFVAHDFNAVLRGDPLAQIEVLRNGIASALVTPNEGRGVLGKPRSDAQGMDDFYLPYNNLQPVGHPAIPSFGPSAMPGSGDPNQNTPPPGAPPGKQPGSPGAVFDSAKGMWVPDGHRSHRNGHVDHEDDDEVAADLERRVARV